MQQRRGTAAEWTSANPVLAAGEIGFETDTNKFKFGDGASAWNDIAHFSSSLDVLGEGVPENLDTLVELANALNNDSNYADTVNQILSGKVDFIIDTEANWAANTDLLATNLIAIDSDNGTFKLGTGGSSFGDLPYVATETYVDATIDSAIADFATENYVETAIAAVGETPIDLAYGTTIGTVTATEIDFLSGVTSAIQSQISDINTAIEANTDASDANATSISTLETEVLGIATLDSQLNAEDGIVDQITAISASVSGLSDDLDTKSPINSPTFTGDVVLPSSTSVGSVTATEISYLSGVAGPIGTSLDAKLEATLAATTYAPLADATLTGTVTLPATTSVGSVTASEIGHLSGVTSSVQTQIDAKAPTADPTFTGTVSGVSASMVGLSNVDNTSDLDKPVSTATQTALNAKLALAGGTMTGKITLDGDPTQALHAVTKQYADSISEGLHIHASVVALSDSAIDLTGATPTTVIDGVTLADGDRVIINGQTDPAENGIYVYTLTGSVFNRAADFDEPGEVAGGDFVFVTGGTDYENTGWVKTSDSVSVIGTDAINFTQFSGAGSVTAGSNIDVTGTQVSVIAAPTFTDKVTVSANGIEFSDGTVQTEAGVPSLTGFTEKTASYQLDTLAHKDNVVEMNSGSALNFTIPLEATFSWPVGASMDIIQTGSGQVTIAKEDGVTLNYTPGNKLRTQWSSCTIMKRAADTWIVYGDLTA
jgi:hypothetical protein